MTADTDWSGTLDEVLKDAGGIMTDWDVEFVDSLANQRNWRHAGWKPSTRILNDLQKIWDKIYG